MKKKYLILLAITGFIIAIDQATKMYVHTNFYLAESVNVFPGFFDITYVRNQGAAFGIFRESAEGFRHLFFLAMPPIAIIFIVMMLRALPENDYVQIIALSLISGGALGNYIDRLKFGYVIDFLDMHFKRIYTWPAFNVSDIAIVTGISILFLIMFIQWREEKKSQA